MLRKDTIRDFLRLESAGGIVLVLAAALAIVIANTPVEIRVGALQVTKPLLLWVNDGLMAVFFFIVGSLLSGVPGYLVLDRTLPKAG